MPLFEFVCTACGQPFEELLRGSNEGNEVNCPVCGSQEVKRRLSTFASRTSGGSTISFSSGSAASCSSGST